MKKTTLLLLFLCAITQAQNVNLSNTNTDSVRLDVGIFDGLTNATNTDNQPNAINLPYEVTISLVDETNRVYSISDVFGGAYIHFYGTAYGYTFETEGEFTLNNDGTIQGSVTDAWGQNIDINGVVTNSQNFRITWENPWGDKGGTVYGGKYKESSIIYIPDTNFKQALLADISVNTNSNNEISVLEAENLTGTINVSQKGISDLTGLEYFLNATALNCQYNYNIERIDISKNTKLEVLKCYGNSLVALDLSQNTALTLVYCYNNDDLECIKVVDENAAILDTWIKDDTAQWSEVCSNLTNKDITNNTFKVYPNPTNNFITIDSTLEGDYNLVSIIGKTIAKGSLKVGDNTLNISTLNKGIYFVNISSNNNSKTIKIVKE